MTSLATADSAWNEIPRPGWTRHLRAVGRGLAVALPVLLVFGALLASADAAFESLLSVPLRVDGAEVTTYLVIGAVCMWLAGGMLRGMAFGDDPEVRRPVAASLTAGIVEVGIVLGLLDLLFLLFVAVQVKYLFGGGSAAVNGLSYSEYARRGFFELVAVSGLALPVILVSRGLLRDGRAVARRAFNLLSGAMILLLFIVMASAVQRMRLYTAEYGLTELRFYSSVFIAWLALAFVWTAITVLRGKAHGFMPGVLLAAVGVVGGLNVVNPDAIIVRTNLARAATHDFDASYNAALSADAVQALVEAVPTLSGPARDRVQEVLRAAEERGNSADWRTWNSSRAAAGWRLKRAGLDKAMGAGQ